MPLDHKKFREDWKNNRASCRERFRLIVSAKLNEQIFSRWLESEDARTSRPGFDPRSGLWHPPYDTNPLGPLPETFLQPLFTRIEYALALRQTEQAKHAEDYVHWRANSDEADIDEIVIAADLFGRVKAHHAPGCTERELTKLLESLLGSVDMVSLMRLSTHSIANAILEHEGFVSCYTTQRYYHSNTCVPENILLLPKGRPPLEGWESFLRRAGGHEDGVWTAEKTRLRLEEDFSIDLAQEPPGIPTLARIGELTGKSAKAVETLMDDVINEREARESPEIMRDEECIDRQYFRFREGVGFGWFWDHE